MRLKISGKGIDIGNSLKSFINEKISTHIDKYFEEELGISVIIGKDNRFFVSEVVLNLHGGSVLQAEGRSEDPYASLRASIEKLEEMIKKHKNRVKNKQRRDIEEKTEFFDYKDKATGIDGEQKESLMIAEGGNPMPELSVRAAIEEFTNTTLPFLVFKNAETAEVNAVYKRPDGHFGCINYK
jgi:ribosomal subunit interface protein